MWLRQASLFALLFFCVTAGKISFSAAVLPYSVAFAATYITASVAMFIAIKTGSLAITSLIGSYSLIIPTFYGFFFLNEKITLFKVFGIAFLLISLFEIRADSREKINKPTAKWIISVITGFIANGMCAVIQNAQQRKFSGAQNSNFMILALLISFAVLLILALIFESGKIVEAIKKGGRFRGCLRAVQRRYKSFGNGNYSFRCVIGILSRAFGGGIGAYVYNLGSDL